MYVGQKLGMLQYSCCLVGSLPASCKSTRRARTKAVGEMMNGLIE
jgi:hypothetical protein